MQVPYLFREVQSKNALTIMSNLPHSLTILGFFRAALNVAGIQANDHVKSAIKNGAVPRNTAIKWIVASRPYFIIHTFGLLTKMSLPRGGISPTPDGERPCPDPVAIAALVIIGATIASSLVGRCILHLDSHSQWKADTPHL